MTNAPSESGSRYRTAPVPSKKLPGGIPYIIANEAAERFSFYGMKGILKVFMTKYLFLMGASAGVAMSDQEATAKYHFWVSAVYLTPLLGAFLSDFVLGKYRTIIWLSMVYCAGHGALACMGLIGDAQYWMLLGLGLIALGAGGIKPCVSAHVGDQFGESNSHMLEKVFNFFYLSINVGAAASNIATPWLLEWYGPHWAFGVPGVLMALATYMFWLGRHKFVHVPPGGLAFLREVFSGEGLFAVGKLCVIYVFVLVFWALFDQTGSSWITQAEDMNREWLGITWLPAQIQVINPVMILTFVPLFTFVVYPLINKVWTLTPLRKISLGLFVMVGGFAMVAVAQQWIDAGERPSIGWQVVAYAILTASEVMVSITCLEFSYTQSPRKMKSLVMGLFFASVSLGNVFTGGVNLMILVPDHLSAPQSFAESVNAHRVANKVLPTVAEAEVPDTLTYIPREDGSYQLVYAGQDEQLGTADDIVIEYGENGTRDDVTAAGMEVLATAAERIEEFYFANKKLPQPGEGNEALAGLVDPWGEPVSYALLNSKQFRVVSKGSDQTELTELDRGYNVKVPDLDPAKQDEKKGLTWLDKRKAELGVKSEASNAEDGPKASRTPFVGGQTKLEGASYFWFFTKLMLGTAIAFMVVAFFYRPREYFQEEAEVVVGDPHE